MAATRPFLILQLRPETDTSDDEYEAILTKGGLSADETHRIRLDQSPIPGDLSLDDYAGVIVGGGPGCVSDHPSEKSPTEQRIEDAVLGLMPQITARDFPFMGCCYGIGILGHHLQGDVSKANYAEPVGIAHCTRTVAGETDPLLRDCPDAFDAFVGHKEALQSLPENCVHLVAAPTCPFQMIRYKSNVYATQFHPEADGNVFETRIRAYRNNGYFPPEDADRLIDMCQNADVHVPERILRAFVTRYRG